MCKEYNGWKNYQTWSVYLVIGNNDDLYKKYTEIARQTKDTTELARILKEDFVTEADEIFGTCESYLCGLFNSLLNNALNQVDWFEVAKALHE